MARKLDNWLEAYRRYTVNVEAPDSYNFWAGIAALSAIVGRKVWVDFPHHQLRWYPALYIVLVGPPGMCRKGSAINPALDLVREVEGPVLIANDITREKLLRRMALKPTKTMLKTGKEYVHCSAVAFAEEFATFIGQKDTDMLDTLTALWNCDPLYVYDTKHQGTDTIENVCLTILAGTTPESLTECLPQTAIGGGFTSRLTMVVETHNEKVISVTEKPTHPVPKGLENQLINDLAHIYKNLRGPFSWTKEAGLWYSKWYKAYMRKAKENTMQDSRFLFYSSRKPTVLWRLAMLLSVAEGDDLELDVRHLEGAEGLVSMLEPNLSSAFGGYGASATSAVTHKMLNYIVANPGITLRTITRLLVLDVKGPDEISQILRGLLQAGMIAGEKKGETMCFTAVEDV